ncbi:MAG TPA: metallophosphoesterase [Solirubrobacteraceae bacterium]|nr:metallophosphoesterase [Solirubrobacteraceae bacterium]
MLSALRTAPPRLAIPFAAAAALGAAAPASAARVTMVAAGNIACPPAANIPTPTSCQQEATAREVERLNPAFIAALGDNQYETGTLDEFRGSFDRTWGRFKSRIRPAAGNHEWRTAGAAGYFDYFGSAAGPRGKGWYSYRAGDWHVIVLNSQCDVVGCGTGSEQDRWLRADLAAHRSEPCTLAYFHHPPFTGGSTRDSPNNVAARSLFATLHGAQADLVLAAHDHAYQRFTPLDSSGAEDQELGLREIVVGTGGNSLHRFEYFVPYTVVRYDRTFGVLHLTLGARDYAWGFHPVAGGTFTDAGSDQCHRAPAALRASVKGGRLATALRRGLRTSVRSDRVARLKASATVNARSARRLGLGRRTVASGRGSARAGGTATQTLRFTRRARSALGRARRVTLTVGVTATTPAARTSTTTRRVTLR